MFEYEPPWDSIFMTVCNVTTYPCTGPTGKRKLNEQSKTVRRCAFLFFMFWRQTWHKITVDLFSTINPKAWPEGQI